MTAVVDANPLEQVGGSSRIIKLVGLVFFIFIGWASLAWVDEIVRAEGEVVSTSRSQIVQNLEGGILAELYVGQGDRAKPDKSWCGCKTPNIVQRPMICRTRSTRWKFGAIG